MSVLKDRLSNKDFCVLYDTFTSNWCHLFLFFPLQAHVMIQDLSRMEESSGTITAMTRQLILYAVLVMIYVVQLL